MREILIERLGHLQGYPPEIRKISGIGGTFLNSAVSES
jgi:hypothetical protein